jgi:nucleoid DNA-binding protein
MNKKELIEEIQAETSVPPKTINEVLTSVCNRIQANLILEDKITITGFGTFKVETKTKGDKLLFKPIFEFAAKVKKAVQK